MWWEQRNHFTRERGEYRHLEVLPRALLSDEVLLDFKGLVIPNSADTLGGGGLGHGGRSRRVCGWIFEILPSSCRVYTPNNHKLFLELTSGKEGKGHTAPLDYT